LNKVQLYVEKAKTKSPGSTSQANDETGPTCVGSDWLTKFSGKNVVRSYANWFGVDLLCAVKELSLLGVTVDPTYVAQLKTTFSSRRSHRPKQPVAGPLSIGYGVDWDENFAYIAGHTEAGFPYGVTWEELVEAEPTVKSKTRASKTVEDKEL
jgi:hypothetical protein